MKHRMPAPSTCTGKNRPLDDEEAQFLDSVAQEEAERQAAAAREEDEALTAFRAACMAAAASGSGSGAEAVTATAASVKATPSAGAGTPAGPRAAVVKAPVRPQVKAVVRVKPKDGGGASGSTGRGQQGSAPTAEPPAKRARPEGEGGQQQGSQPASPDGGGLDALLGGYCSGSDDE